MPRSLPALFLVAVLFLAACTPPAMPARASLAEPLQHLRLIA